MADNKDRDGSAPESVGIEEADIHKDVEANPHKAAADKDVRGLDKATEFLKQADHQVVVTLRDSRRVAKLIDWRILPILL
jgi:DNA-binding MurR/RpiR family transcriptional regulator